VHNITVLYAEVVEWQTRRSQNPLGKPVGVRVPPSALRTLRKNTSNLFLVLLHEFCIELFNPFFMFEDQIMVYDHKSYERPRINVTLEVAGY
jgi:hypothetical protein